MGNKLCFKLLLVISLSAIFITVSSAKDDKATGKVLYEKHCVKCHGDDGKRGKFKAKDLQLSRVADSTILTLLKTGKKAMPSYAKKMTIEEMKSIISYTKTLRSR